MNKIARFVLPALVVGFFLSACGITVRSYQSGDILVADDFVDNSRGWKTFDNQSGSSVALFDGGILLVQNAILSDVLTTVRGDFTDTTIKVTARKYSGTDNNLFGVICRYQNDLNYYGFLITSDGYFGIFKIHNGDYQLINSDNLVFSEKIRQNKIPNQMQASCLGSSLDLMVNGELLVSVIDQSFSAGKTGLFVGTYKEKNTAVHFDNFIVTYP